MGAESGLGSQGKKKKKGRKNGRQKKAAVQRLSVVCREVFALGRSGVAPLIEDVERIRSILDSMTPADVDLSPLSPYFGDVQADAAVKPIAYLHVYGCDSFTICIFCLPASAVIPLHNHPGMTVFSKLLFGSMHIKSYDWVDDGASGRPEVRLAKVAADAVVTAPCDTSILYPTSGGNIHCFTALTACAILDVLGPPYSDPEGRHCTYYIDHPYWQFSTTGPHSNGKHEDGEYAWLEERERPSDLCVIGGKYTGPQITDAEEL